MILNGISYAWVGLRQSGGGTQLVFATCDRPGGKCQEKADTVLAEVRKPVYLRIRMKEGGVTHFSYSLDNELYAGRKALHGQHGPMGGRVLKL